MWQEEPLPAGTLAIEPRCVGSGQFGQDWLFLASRDGGNTWIEYHTVLESAAEWFELVVESISEDAK